MNKIFLFLITVSLLFLSGCASIGKCRFSLIELDLRTPEQIMAGTVENTAIYEGTNKPPQIIEKTPRSFPIEIIFKFLEVIKGRIKIISLEWKSNQEDN